MYTAWHVDKYKITFKLVINHWTNEILQHSVISSSLSRPGIIDARARYRATVRRLRNTDLPLTVGLCAAAHILPQMPLLCTGTCIH